MVRRSRLSVLAVAVVAAGASAACKPDVVGRASLVDGDRVLAVSSDRPEAKPGDTVTYRALYVGSKGPPDPAHLAGLEWAFCNTQKPLAVTGPIAPACLAPSGPGLAPLASGPTASGKIPADACKIFGPFPPDPKMGEPPGRPADPDTTGGYYQPVRLLAPAEGEPDYSVGVTRLACGLSGATLEQSADYQARYRANENPALDSLVLTHSGGRSETLAPDGSGDAARVAPGETITLRASWAVCPSAPVCGDGICSPTELGVDCKDGEPLCCPADCLDPKGCTGSEPYVGLDPVAHAIASRRESIRLSWFATDGDYSHDRTGVAEDDPAPRPYSDDEWTAPSTSGRVWLWVVTRDDRGGVGFTSYEVDVHP